MKKVTQYDTRNYLVKKRKGRRKRWRRNYDIERKLPGAQETQTESNEQNERYEIG